MGRNNTQGNAEFPIKVLFLAGWYPNEDHPISGIFIKQHAEAVAKFSDVTVLYIHQSQNRETTEIEYSVEDSIKTIRYYLRKPPLKGIFLRIYNYTIYNTILGDIRLLLHGWNAMSFVKEKTGKPDIVHLHVIRPMGIIAILLKNIKGIPFISTEYLGPLNIQVNSIMKKSLYRGIMHQSAVLVPISTSLEKEMREISDKGLFHIVPCAIDTERFVPNLSKERNPKIKKIIHVSLLTEEDRKNVKGIITAVHEISKKRKDFSLNIIGDGTTRKALQEMASHLGLLDNFVFFLGRLSDEELIDQMKNSDFFVLNSYHENFSLVCAEALSAGIPVISTKCGGPEDYMTEQTGILITPGNNSQLVKAIDYMLDNFAKYNPAFLHSYIDSKYSRASVGYQYFQIYRSLLREWKIGYGLKKVDIDPEWIVADIGSGHHPHKRANILLDNSISETEHRSGEKALIQKDKDFILADALKLPLKPKSIDFTISTFVAEHVDDPEKFLEEMSRISKRGYIETPGPLTEFLLNEPYHKWIIKVKEGNLIFTQKIRFHSYSETFYRIFYYGDAQPGHKKLTFDNRYFDKVFKKIRFLLNWIWKYLPFSYTYYPWQNEIRYKIKNR